ncbi:MAG: hypothetical protein OXU81_24130, partial [Gammaproteobacteria bacterium]|nr:hypothetical protein [Gammaproteobacteria bacterium]
MNESIPVDAAPLFPGITFHSHFHGTGEIHSGPEQDDDGSRPMPMSLEHLKVLDLTIHLSGPYCAMVLA